MRALTLSAAALGLLAAAGAGAAETQLTVTDAWMRATIPGRPAAGYFTLANKSAVAVTLLRAASPACQPMMLHQSLSTGGVDRMVMVKSIKVPAKGSVSFAPGGYHLMCMAPTADVTPGKSVPVTLTFGDGTILTESFPVRNAAGK